MKVEATKYNILFRFSYPKSARDFVFDLYFKINLVLINEK